MRNRCEVMAEEKESESRLWPALETLASKTWIKITGDVDSMYESSDDQMFILTNHHYILYTHIDITVYA